MKRFFRNIVLLLVLGLLGACRVSQATPVSATPTVTPTATMSVPAGFTENQARTLASLKQVDEFPLYTMRYYGEYDSFLTSRLPASAEPGSPPAWACSLFTVLLGEDHLLYGRNFDWEFSPALLLFTDPPDGYSSVSMVDLAPSKINRETLLHLTDTPLGEVERRELLYAPLVPYDGMNEHGLAIAMAAVTPGNMQADPSKKTTYSLGIIRQILDHARDVDEAVEIITGYNIDFTGGPPLHYLIADAQGKAVLVEFYRGEMHILKNEQPWHLATNFLRSSVEDPKDGQCWRYDRLHDRLNEKQGLLDSKAAMELLAEVAQDNTQWSVVYQMARGEVSVAMGQDYANVHTFQISDYFDPK